MCVVYLKILKYSAYNNNKLSEINKICTCPSKRKLPYYVIIMICTSFGTHRYIVINMYYRCTRVANSLNILFNLNNLLQTLVEVKNSKFPNNRVFYDVTHCHIAVLAYSII